MKLKSLPAKTKRLMAGFEVEWCKDVPKIPGTNDSDMDRADWRTQDFAKDRLPHDYFGSVRVTPFEMEEYEPGCGAYHKVYTADSTHVENE